MLKHARSLCEHPSVKISHSTSCDKSTDSGHWSNRDPGNSSSNNNNNHPSITINTPREVIFTLRQPLLLLPLTLKRQTDAIT